MYFTLLREATAKSAMLNGTLYIKFLLLGCTASCLCPGEMLPVVLDCIVLSVTKYKGFQKSPTLFSSCAISMVMLGATAAVPSHISAQKEAVGFLGIIYASFMVVKCYTVYERLDQAKSFYFYS